MEENKIRRERMRKLQRKKGIEEMRAALPVYPLEEIRIRRMVYHEALLCTLRDKGYVNTSNYIKLLFQLQSEKRSKAGPTSILWLQPLLCESKSELKLVAKQLSRAEEHHNLGNYTQECQEMLQVATYFAFSNEFWWWLGEHFLINIILMCKEYRSLDKMYEALTRYCYGKFLMEHFKDDSSALEHLNVARNLSSGKQWTTKLLFPSDVDILYLKVNYLMYLCLIRQVEKLMESDCKEAGRLAVIARKRAADACFVNGEIRALLLKGMCQIAYNDTKGAIESFTKTFYIESRRGCHKGTCEARIHIAQAYLLDGDSNLSLKILLLLKESAEEHNLPYYLAQSYRHLGEFFLNQNKASRASLLLKESRKIFEKYKFIKEGDQVRNLEAISLGLEYFSKYIQLLTESNENTNMCSLIDWKDLRMPFFELIGRSYSLDDIILESIAEVKGRRSANPEVPPQFQTVEEQPAANDEGNENN